MPTDPEKSAFKSWFYLNLTPFTGVNRKYVTIPAMKQVQIRIKNKNKKNAAAAAASLFQEGRAYWF